MIYFLQIIEALVKSRGIYMILILTTILSDMW